MFTLKNRAWNWYLLISLIGSALLGASTPALAAPLAYTASVKPTSGPAGSAATVSTSGFTPGFNAAVRWGGEKGPDLWTTKSSTTSFIADITIPADAKPGIYTLFVCNNCGGGEFQESAITQFEVTEAQATPIPAPVLKSFFADQTTLKSGECTTLHWEAFDATSVYLTTPNGQEGVGGVDSRQACPKETFTYLLTVNGYPGAQPPSQQGQVVITVTQSQATSTVTATKKATSTPVTKTPTAKARATSTATRPPVSPTALPVLGDFDFGPLINPATDPGLIRALGYCSSINFGTGERIIDFEDQSVGTSLANQYSSQGVRFGPGTAFVDRPPVGTHSPSQAVRSPSDDFGSAFHPILMHFDTLMSAVGLFVGSEAPAFPGESPATATLTAFGQDSSGHLISIAEDHIFLPTGPVPIERCLIVRAPEGQGIRAARLEYTDWEGTSHTTHRWLDDLTLLRSSTTGRDARPVVAITIPHNGDTVTSSGVSLFARITEDIGLTSVYARVNGGAPQTLAVSQTASDPAQYTAGITLSGLTPFASNTVEVQAYDTRSQSGSATITFTYQPASGVDLSLNRVEVTQAIQCLNNTGCADNSVPLYVNKPTLVRAYVFLDRGPTTLANISGRLCRGDSGSASCVSPLRPIRSINLNQANNSIAALRNDLALTLNFLLPMDWVSRAGSLDFTVYVNYNGENAAECCSDNNRQHLTLSVRTGRTVDIVFLPVRASGIQPDINERWASADWLFRVYPVSRIGVWENPDLVGNNYNFMSATGGGGTFGAFSGCGQGWGDLMSDLWWFNVWHGDPVDWLRYYGMVDQRALAGAPYSGCGMTPGSVAGGIVSTGDRNGPETTAQEVAHNHGRLHAPSGGAAGTDSGYPNPSGLLDEWGVDVGRMQLYPPTSSFDYMGYGGSEGDTWTSVYTYRAMASAIQSVAQAPTGNHIADPARPQIDPGEFFIGSGLISPNNLKVLNGFYRATLPSTTSDGLISGPYTAQMLDDTGKVLYARGFSLPQLSNEQVEAGGFHIILPWKEGTTAVAFQYNDVEVGRVTRSASAPQVKVTAPLGGEHWGSAEEQTFTWAATDPDGDPLMYSVQYSPDKGQTWFSIGVNVTDTGIKINTAHLPGGEAGLVRVTASDGFNSTAAESPSTFTVEGHAPEVFIGSPDDGMTIIEGDPVVLHAYGTDTEDGALAEGAFEWTSSADGSLGNGDLIIASALSVGAHDVTVTGKDAQGNTATYTVKITVQPAPTAPAQPNSGTIPGRMPLLLIGLGGVIVLVGLVVVIVAVAAIVLGRRRRA